MKKVLNPRLLFGLTALMTFALVPAFAHCDSYDGPVIKDAQLALKENKVELVFKWISPGHEAEIEKLFNTTASLKGGDKEVYSIVEKHFFETLVRLHREGEGAPYTGLKPAGSTEPIIVLADDALAKKDLDGLTTKLNTHIEKVIREKFLKVVELEKVRNESVEQGRAYVAAYVDYTHTLEAIHAPLEHGAQDHSGGHAAH